MLSAMILIGFSILSMTSGQTNYVCDRNASCGCSKSPALVSRIFGGETALNNTWGWAVSVLFNSTYYCGATLISPSAILTVASCVGIYRAPEIAVSVATNRLLGWTQWRYTSVMIKHPNYDPVTRVNDIALLRVSPPFDMTDQGIAQICVPMMTTEDYPMINTSLVAVGWGKQVENGSAVIALQQVTLKRISYDNNTCAQVAPNRSLQFCAAVENSTKTVCAGDQGSPLMMFTPSRQWVLVGIVSSVYSCPSIYPSGYTRMTRFLDWIRSMNVTDAVAIDIANTSPIIPPMTSVITNAATSMAPINTSVSTTSTPMSILNTNASSTSLLMNSTTSNTADPMLVSTTTQATSHSTAGNKGDSPVQHTHIAATAMALFILVVMAP